MSENKRYTIKPQDDYFGITDNYSFDKVCVINGIRTKIEAEWLCDEMNKLNDENMQLKKENIALEENLEYYKVKYNELKQQVGRIQYLIDNKIDEFKNGDYGDLPCNVIHMFLDLKQEIGDLE